MLDKWKALTQDNQVKLLIVFLTAVFAVLGYFWQSGVESKNASDSEIKDSVTISTSGDNSPVASGTQGDVTININGSNTGKMP